MNTHPLAGVIDPKHCPLDPNKLISAYYQNEPDPDSSGVFVNFGTGGYRGSPFCGKFNVKHVHAIVQAICDYRKVARITGPVFLGKDSHAVSSVAEMSTIEVLEANQIEILLAKDQYYGSITPTPAVSFAINQFNLKHPMKKADGIIITPSHNPPDEGGIKYNNTHGGPSDVQATKFIQIRSNELLLNNLVDVKITPYHRAIFSPLIMPYDYVHPYVESLNDVINMDIIRSSNVKIGVDPLGGASLPFWEPIKEKYKLNLTLMNQLIDPTFGYIPLDHDGKVRMDCSSVYTVSHLLMKSGDYDVVICTDTDADRHGIIADLKLLNSNHFLALAINHLLLNRYWPTHQMIGKSTVSSFLIDKIAHYYKRGIYEVPVGFKWMSRAFIDGRICFGGEESAGASFLKKNGTFWTADKDGIIMGLLAAEITACNNNNCNQLIKQMFNTHGEFFCTKGDFDISPGLAETLKNIRHDSLTQKYFAGDPIVKFLTKTPVHGELMGGFKVITKNGWYAARPSGTENKCRYYAESFLNPSHLDSLTQNGTDVLSQFQILS